ncbi:hypothetical protein E2C01_008369 [Portunus trituberculatus]|uniref:Uncharacterized protein n=1 Tax=Portunus trituberculatus TaxID=210409 RepID=A0A5B7D2X9_PORTR|nr:hypothetical protein [Portunus trituberculatus]
MGKTGWVTSRRPRLRHIVDKTCFGVKYDRKINSHSAFTIYTPLKCSSPNFSVLSHIRCIILEQVPELLEARSKGSNESDDASHVTMDALLKSFIGKKEVWKSASLEIPSKVKEVWKPAFMEIPSKVSYVNFAYYSAITLKNDSKHDKCHTE